MVDPLLTVVSWLFVWLSAANAADDPLWRRAVALAGSPSDLIPSGAHVRTEVRDGDGNAREIRETWVRFRLRSDGALESTIVRRRENGRELRAGEIERQNRNDTALRRSAPFQITDSPFNAALQRNVRHHRLNEDGGAIVFAFELDKGRRSLVGKAWIDAASGAPLRVELRPTPTPRWIDRFDVTIEYRSGDDRRCRPFVMTIDGVSSPLWIRRVFRSVYHFGSAP
jgi:hypothetical protein